MWLHYWNSGIACTHVRLSYTNTEIIWVIAMRSVQVETRNSEMTVSDLLIMYAILVYRCQKLKDSAVKPVKSDQLVAWAPYRCRKLVSTVSLWNQTSQLLGPPDPTSSITQSLFMVEWLLSSVHTLEGTLFLKYAHRRAGCVSLFHSATAMRGCVPWLPPHLNMLVEANCMLVFENNTQLGSQ